MASATLSASTTSIALSSTLASLQSEVNSVESVTTTTGTDSAGSAFTSTITGATSTSGDTPTKAVQIHLPSGTNQVYALSLDPAQLSSYGNVSNSSTTFICADEGCQFTVINVGYSDLWRAIVNTTGAYNPTSLTKCNPLIYNTNYYSPNLINQDDLSLRNRSALYQWAVFDSKNATSPIATSKTFQMNITDWNYSSGKPQAGAYESSQSGRKSSISGGAIAGVVIGVLLILIIALGAFYMIRRRKRKDKRTSTPAPGAYEKGTDNPLSKPELVGTTITNGGMPHNKPELAATSRLLPPELSSSQDTSTRHGGSTGSSEGTKVAYGGGSGASTDLYGEQEEKQVTESERLIPSYMEVRESHPGQHLPQKQNVITNTAMTRPAAHEDINVLKAQEREMAHQMEVSEELQRMRAEHTALLDRIRIAEMREREVRGGL